ncbi:MAG: methylmalonyl-CoA epimerase [Deferribacterota bacterium]|nr:methylmalonyl-CoA epimerase [Deferribacterota bacterium]
MFKQVDHIGIAVKNIDEASRVYKLLNMTIENEEVVENQQVKTLHIKAGNTNIELLEPLNEASPIYKFIEKNGEGLHHIAFEVDNIEKAINLLRESGYTFTFDKPVIGAGNKKVIFIHPKSTNHTLIELIS